LNTAADKVGLDEIGTHTLRKTFGYLFYQKTKDVAQLQELFNHSAPSVTLRYIGINQDVMDKAIDDFSL
jgi:integrase